MLRAIGQAVKYLGFAFIGIVCCLTPQANASFDELPADLQITIWSKTTLSGEEGEVPVLSLKDLGNCARVSRQWNERSSDDRVWKFRFERAYGLARIPAQFYQSSSAHFHAIVTGDEKYKNKQIVRQKGKVWADLSSKSPKDYTAYTLQNITEVLRDSGDVISKEQLESANCKFIFLMLALEQLGDTSLIDTYLSGENVRAHLDNVFEDFRSALGFLIKRGSKVARTYQEKLPPKSL